MLASRPLDVQGDDTTGFSISVDEALIQVERSDEELIARVVIVDAEGAPLGVKEQAIPWPMLEASNVDVLKERARARLADVLFELEFATPWEVLRPPRPFVPVGPISESDPALYRAAVREAVRIQAHADGWERRFERLTDWIPEAATLYFLDALDASAGGDGLEVFLSQGDPEDVVGVLEALGRAGCERFVALYQRAIGRAVEQGYELASLLDEEWLAEASLPHESASWEAIDSWEDGGSWALLRDEVRPAIDALIERERAALVAMN